MSLDKDIEKMTQKLKGKKRRFRIEAGYRGGEVGIGKVNADFVDHFINPEDGDGDLIDFVTSFDWDEVDESIPVPYEDFESWTETTEIEHLNGAYADGQWSYEEVPADGSDDYAYETVIDFDAYHLYGREAYMDDKKPEDMTNYKPVLQFHSGEKGGFGAWFVETVGEDFNPKKVAFSSVESQVAEIVQDMWYDKELIDKDYDNCDTTGKGYYASVGYMNMKWHDSEEKYTEEFFTENEIWECYEDELLDE
jgi:hypothetical protein|tara:strand:- start:1737 stop:2489 length:753 start_codon:yes stop_codon:yes gene_type:complete